MKTLIVSYLPGGNSSNSKKMLNYFLQKISNENVNHIDLLKDPPAWFDETSLQAYYKRNGMGQELNKEQERAIAQIDKYLPAIKDAEIVILVHPMHNFGMPGIVKLWFDSIMQQGVAFQYGPKGPEGLFKGKKALTLYTSAGSYSTEKVSLNYPEWNTLSFLSKIEFMFMGFDEIEVIGASTGDNSKLKENLTEAYKQIDELISKWY